MSEIWKPVVGFEGLYEVSNLGRVRSLDRISVRSDGFTRFFPGQMRKIQRDPKGYPQLTIQHEGEKRNVRVHTLVAEAFHGSRPDGLEVRHLDDDKQNNAASNLLWGSAAENVTDKIVNGKTVKGEHCHFHKVTAEDVRDIRRLSGRLPQWQIAAQYGLTQQGVSDIVRRKAWRHV